MSEAGQCRYKSSKVVLAFQVLDFKKPLTSPVMRGTFK